MIDIIHAYEEVYDEIVLLAGSVYPRNNQLSDKVKVHYLAKYDRISKTKRILTWLIAFIQIIWIIKTRYKNAFLFIVTNPPLTTFIPFFCNNKFLLLFYDIYPDALTEFKILKESSWFVRLWKSANKKIFCKATRLITISEGMQKILIQHSGKKNVDVIPIWTDNNFFINITKEQNFFLKEQFLKNKFVVLYSGNLGYSHDVDVIVDLAELLQHNDVFFLIIGSGEKYADISTKIISKRLTNCRILPLQPIHILPYSFAAADIAIVTLSKNASHLSVPSKTYNYLSVGAPLLCIAENNSELNNLVSNYKIGKCFSKNEIHEICEYILCVKNNHEYHNYLKINALKASLDFGTENAKKFVSYV